MSTRNKIGFLFLVCFLFCLALSQAKEEKIVLRVWGMMEGEMGFGIKAAAAEFDRRHPNLKIERSKIPSRSLGVQDPQKLICGVAGGVPPDVVQQDRFSIGDWASRDAFIPLDEFIERDKDKPDGIRPEEFYEACWKEAIYEGKVYAIPKDTDTRALYYNKSMLLEAGLVDEHGQPKPPRDWNELREYAIRLTKRDERGRLIRVGFIPDFGNSWLYLYGFQNGGQFMSPDGRTCLLNEPEIVEALEYIVSLYNELGGAEELSAFWSSFQSGAMDPFFIGRVAMKIDIDPFSTFIAQYKPDMNYGVAPPPPPKGKPIVTWSGGLSFAIPRGAKHPEMAWEFIKWMVSADAYEIQNSVQASYNLSYGKTYIPILPARKTLTSIYEKYLPSQPNLRQNMLKFLKLLPYSKYRPVTPVGQLLWDEHVRATKRAVYHLMTPKEALNYGQQQVQKRLNHLFRPELPPLLNWRYPAIFSVLLIFAALIAFLIKVNKTTRHAPLIRPEIRAGLLFSSPWLIGFLVFILGPIIASIVFSICEYDVLHPPRYVGIENYQNLLFKDPLFWKSLWNTVFMVISVPLGMAVSLAIAMFLNQKIRGISTYRTLFYMPAIVPVVASSILWMWVLNTQHGLLNSLVNPVYQFLGMEPLIWLESPKLSKPSIVLMLLWGAGASMIIWLAGLQGIPQTLYEAAEIDGAGWWGKFRNVTIPMLTPYIFFNLVMGIIYTFQIFTQAYVMTEGGPIDSTLFYVYYLFNSAFVYMRMGYASAMAWILFIIILVLTLINFKLAPRWVYYEAEQR